MKYVKLVKGIDYRGHGVKAIFGKPLAVEGDKANILVKSGFFAVDDTVAPQEEEKDDAPEQKPVEKMKKEQLIEYAEQNGIDISACQNNDERVATIKAATVGEAEIYLEVVPGHVD